MEDKKKKPDLVAWDEERGYYARELEYGSNIGAPAIATEEIPTWKQRGANLVNAQLKTRYEELKAEVKKLIEDYNWNELIYKEVQYNFQPTIGEMYYLYIREDGSLFLSLIEPHQWTKECIGGFKLDSNNKWIKIGF